jgi:SHS2 domain-containing protein
VLDEEEEQKTKGYRFLEHITDAEIEAYGSNLDEAFENAGRALEDTMVDIKTIRQKKEDRITVQGKDKQELLYEWLEFLITKQDTEGMLYSKFICKISRENSKLFLEAQAFGEKFDPERHEQKTAIKAPTYYDMLIDESSDQEGIKLKFLLDL